MKLSLVLIVYRSDSSRAQEASKFCEEVLKAKNIKSKRIESDFHDDEIEKYLCNSESQPDIGIVLIDRSLSRGLSPGIVLIDGGYGNNTTSLEKLEERELKYLRKIAKN